VNEYCDTKSDVASVPADQPVAIDSDKQKGLSAGEAGRAAGILYFFCYFFFSLSFFFLCCKVGSLVSFNDE
jgi:hypothetical protein